VAEARRLECGCSLEGGVVAWICDRAGAFWLAYGLNVGDTAIAGARGSLFLAPAIWRPARL
jgi:hypothetical protein